jgi:DNA-binding MarR family transcriptional regulator
LTTRLEETRGCLNALIRRTSRIVARHYDDVLKPTGLKSTQFTMLAALAQTGPISLTELASLLGTERSALARNLKPLERSGFAGVSTGDDRRVRIVELTRAGRQKLEKALPHWAKAQGRLAKDLGSSDVSRLVALLRSMAEHVDSNR